MDKRQGGAQSNIALPFQGAGRTKRLEKQVTLEAHLVSQKIDKARSQVLHLLKRSDTDDLADPQLLQEESCTLQMDVMVEDLSPEPRGSVATRGMRSRRRMSSRCQDAAWPSSQWLHLTAWAGCAQTVRQKSEMAFQAKT